MAAISTIITESAGSNLRYVANTHSFMTWTGLPQVGVPLSETLSASNFMPVMSLNAGKLIVNNGVIFDANSNAMWIPGSTLSWQATQSPPVFTLATGGVMAYSTQTGFYRYAGNEVNYNINIAWGNNTIGIIICFLKQLISYQLSM